MVRTFVYTALVTFPAFTYGTLVSWTLELWISGKYHSKRNMPIYFWSCFICNCYMGACYSTKELEFFYESFISGLVVWLGFPWKKVEWLGTVLEKEPFLISLNIGLDINNHISIFQPAMMSQLPVTRNSLHLLHQCQTSFSSRTAEILLPARYRKIYKSFQNFSGTILDFNRLQLLIPKFW